MWESGVGAPFVPKVNWDADGLSGFLGMITAANEPVVLVLRPAHTVEWQTR